MHHSWEVNSPAFSKDDEVVLASRYRDTIINNTESLSEKSIPFSIFFQVSHHQEESLSVMLPTILLTCL